MNEAQKDWLARNPRFSPVGPPRPIKFSEWGRLSAEGFYERMDNQPGKPIRVGDGSVGVGIVTQKAEPKP